MNKIFITIIIIISLVIFLFMNLRIKIETMQIEPLNCPLNIGTFRDVEPANTSDNYTGKYFLDIRYNTLNNKTDK